MLPSLPLSNPTAAQTSSTSPYPMASEAALTPAAARAIAPELFPKRTPISASQISSCISKCLEIQRRAVTFGKRPFASLLLGPDNETVLLMHQSVDQVNHAESSLARLAYSHYSKEFLWRCTLVSTWEPCAMCSGMSGFLRNLHHFCYRQFHSYPYSVFLQYNKLRYPSTRQC